MALNSYAQFTINAAALNGITSVSNIGGIDVAAEHIECFSVSWGSHLKNPSSSSRSRNRLQRNPFTLIKPIDNTTVLLYQALARNERIDGEIKLFNSNPDSGETQHFFTLKIEQARVISLESVSPSTINAETTSLVATEQLQLLAQTVTYIDELSGTEYEQR